MGSDLANVVAFIDKSAAEGAIRLDIGGTAFQQRVWQALREIPAGTTASYAEIADRIGSPQAVRAVASACAANALAVAIPAIASCAATAPLGLSLGRGAQARAARAGSDA